MDVTGKVFSNLKACYPKLTATDKRIAAILTDDPEFIAFGTVAEVASRADTSGPSVVRMAEKLGYEGFVGLQSAVRDDLSKYLPSSLLRIERNNEKSSIDQMRLIEQHNVEATLNKLSEVELNKFLDLLSDQDRTVYILASDQCLGAALTFADLLSVARSNVVLLKGSEYRIASVLIESKSRDVLVTIDFERHEKWLLKVQQQAIDVGLNTVAVTNNPLSSIAIGSKIHFFASATAPGPFDSNTGLNALLNVFVDQYAKRDKQKVSRRLKKIHQHWDRYEVFES